MWAWKAALATSIHLSSHAFPAIFTTSTHLQEQQTPARRHSLHKNDKACRDHDIAWMDNFLPALSMTLELMIIFSFFRSSAPRTAVTGLPLGPTSTRKAWARLCSITNKSSWTFSTAYSETYILLFRYPHCFRLQVPTDLQTTSRLIHEIQYPLWTLDPNLT